MAWIFEGGPSWFNPIMLSTDVWKAGFFINSSSECTARLPHSFWTLFLSGNAVLSIHQPTCCTAAGVFLERSTDGPPSRFFFTVYGPSFILAMTCHCSKAFGALVWIRNPVSASMVAEGGTNFRHPMTSIQDNNACSWSPGCMEVGAPGNRCSPSCSLPRQTQCDY